MNRLSLGLAALLLMTCVAMGCNTGGPGSNYVEGVVTLDGQPIEGVTVGFSPTEGSTGVPAVGMTDANGVFKLTSIQGGEPERGAEAGEYNVTFAKSVTSTGSDSVTKSEDEGYGKVDYSREPLKTEHIIPPKYGDPKTSGFTVRVKSGKNTGDEFKFDLKKE
jgi:hypothetical protein